MEFHHTSLAKKYISLTQIGILHIHKNTGIPLITGILHYPLNLLLAEGNTTPSIMNLNHNHTNTPHP